MRRLASIAAALLVATACAQAQQDSATQWLIGAISGYSITPNIVYVKANGFECKLDVIAARDHSRPRPTVVYIHGGGWVGGTKEDALLQILPYLTKGMNAVNVEYRLASVSLAPAAVEDCRCALRWVYDHSKDYGFDLSKLIVTGHSAGGHLSLMTGMLTSSAGFDNQCPGSPEMKVAAIVNHYGITDVGNLLGGPNREDYAVMWLGSLPNRTELARSVSPLTYVRKDLPPTISIHGDADDTVPYQHAVRLHHALEAAGVPNQLVTIPGGKHGDFGAEQDLKVYDAIFNFLRQHGVLSR